MGLKCLDNEQSAEIIKATYSLAHQEIPKRKIE